MNLYSDGLYKYNLDDNGNPINVLPIDGLLINGAPISNRPPFNKSSVYEFDIVGTGDEFEFVFYDPGGSADNEDSTLAIQISGPGIHS